MAKHYGVSQTVKITIGIPGGTPVSYDPLLDGLMDEDRRELVRQGVNFTRMSENDIYLIKQYRKMIGLA